MSVPSESDIRFASCATPALGASAASLLLDEGYYNLSDKSLIWKAGQSWSPMLISKLRVS